ncbi:hypothetical protein Hanom_Chr08g00729961 [Helianthus anomalus]
MNFLIEARTINSSSSLSFNSSNILTFSSLEGYRFTYDKPSFFHDKNHANLFAVETELGKLVKTDNGTPLAQKLKLLRSERDWIEDQAHHLRWSLEHEDIYASENEKLSAKLELLEIEKLKEIIKELVKEKEEDKERFNGIIGGLMAQMEKKKERRDRSYAR